MNRDKKTAHPNTSRIFGSAGFIFLIQLGSLGRWSLQCAVAVLGLSAIRVMLVKKKDEISRLGALSRRRDIIAEYGDHGSQAFAPLTKLGLFPDRCQNKYRVNSRFLNSYRGTASLPPARTAAHSSYFAVTPWASTPLEHWGAGEDARIEAPYAARG